MPEFSPATRRLLIHFALGEWDKPLPRVDADWDEVLTAVRRHRIAGRVYYFLARHEGDYPPESFRRSINLVHYQQSRLAIAQYRDFKAVAGRLLDNGVDFLIVKGPVLAHTIYPNAAIRYIRDTDIIIRGSDREATHATLESLGYHVAEGGFGYLPPLVPGVLPMRHAQYVKPQSPLLVEIHYDNFLLDDLMPRDLDAIWRRAIPVDIEGVMVRTPAPEDHCLHLCAHAHQHRFSLLFWLSDLLLLLRTYDESFDWPLFLRTVETESAQVPVYYAFSLLNALFGQEFPDGVMEALRPDRFRRWWHERLIPQERTLQLTSDDYPPLSFKSMPLFDSTLTNLLVMSRRPEKIKFLFRLLFPTREWLRYRYNLSPEDNVLPLYFTRLFSIEKS